MKVLGLHGKQQNADVFHTRCSKLIAKAQRLKLITLFHCIDGAHQLPLRAGDEVPMRSWYERQRSGAIIHDSLEQSLQRIEAAWKEVGPFEGLLGFSMGGSMAAIVASLPDRFPGLRFIIIAGAPDLDDRSLSYQLFEPPALRSLHLIGLADRTVEPHSSHSLAAKFTAPQVVEHELGHCIPSKAAHIDCMLDFLQRMVRGPRETVAAAVTVGAARPLEMQQNARTVPAQKPQRKKHFCASDDVAALQSEEVEVLLAMYPDEIRFVAADWEDSGSVAAAAFAVSSGTSYSTPNKSGDPCVSLHVSLALDPQQFEPRAAEGFPQSWVGNIGLLFHFTAGYPLSEPPLVTATTGKLTLHDGFSDARVRSLEAAVASACCVAGGEAFAGEACVMLCVQAATDWFSTGLWRSPSSGVAAAAAASARRTVADSHRGEEDSCSSDEEDQDGQELPAEADALAVEEAQEAEFIRLATAEACSTACQERQRLHAGGPAPKHGGRGAADEQVAALLPPSARGVWTYTVGLVGKPSAGKSTFYNAVTRAALERGGRLMAEVAPHPFTTIEPNVGPGWYASFQAEREFSDECYQQSKEAGAEVSHFRRFPLHGRVPSTAGNAHSIAGRRLLPVVVKDVAGLVPGAYKGRGKGNRFLADLCDADVLVHVVDVTGRADKDGNAVFSEGHSVDAGVDGRREEKGSSPSEDAEWIREELHRWIHGNVRGKWASVTACTRVRHGGGGKIGSGGQTTQQQRDRCAQRVLALFTGYQGPKWCVEKAAERAGLNLDVADKWQPLDLHRMVAHFLSIRFPVCLALNKIDALGADQDAQGVVAQCQDTARLRGEVAVPVSARAECFELNRQAALTDSAATSRRGDVTAEKAIYDAVIQQYGTTGVLEAISAAVALKPPVLCYPVCDLESECPVGWTAGKLAGAAAAAGSGPSGAAPPRLQDCLQMKPGSTVGDAFEALKRGVLSSSAAIVHGEFVRAEGRALGVASEKSIPKIAQLKKDSLLDATNSILRIQTNRKSIWQGASSGCSVDDCK